MRAVVVLACIAIAINGLKIANSFVAPILFAGFLMMINAPLVDGLHRKGLPRWLGNWLSGPVLDANEIDAAVTLDTTPAT